MKAIKCIISLFLLMFLVPAPVMEAQGGEPAQRHQSVGLVFSGGGAKGIAHIGVIKAFEENNIPIDYVTGTSMGAIVGALYVCGYSPEEMMELLTSRYFLNMSTGTIDPSLDYYFTSEPPSPRIFNIPLKGAGSAPDSIFNPQSLINPMPMEFGFMQIFGPYNAQCGGDYSRLMVPFRCVASDVEGRHAFVMRGGDLSQSVHASMSFPLVFQATMINDTILYDGGIYDNFPVDVMREDFAPSIVLGIDVGTPDHGQPNSFMRQLDLLVMQPQDLAISEDVGMRIHVDCSDFSLLDFPQAQAIYERGYQTAMAALDSVKARVHTRTPDGFAEQRRRAFKAATPPMRFDSINVTGGDRHQNEYVRYLFRPHNGTDTIGIETARAAYYRALSSGKFSLLRPKAYYNPETGLFRMDLQTQVKSRFSLGFGGYITSTTNSFLYISTDYRSLSFSSVNTSLEAWIGQSYMAGVLKGSVFLHTPLPSAFFFEGVAQRHRYPKTDRIFYHDDEPAAVSEHQYFAKAGFAIGVGRTGRAVVGIGGGHVYNSFYSDVFAGARDIDAKDRDFAKLNMGQVFAGFASSTLDHLNYPTSGQSFSAKAAAVLGRSYVRSHTMALDGKSHRNRFWARMDVDYKNYIGIDRHWALGIEASTVITTQPLLESYDAAKSISPVFTPTPASTNNFHMDYRNNSYVAAGLVPVWIPRENLTVRFNNYAYVPVRRILENEDGSARYSGKWFGSAYYFGELAVNYKLPFADVTAYGNYDGASDGFNFGLSLGFYITAPKFL